MPTRLARERDVQLGDGSGQAQPVGPEVETFGIGRLPDEEIKRRVLATFDIRPAAILARLGLHPLPRELAIPFTEASPPTARLAAIRWAAITLRYPGEKTGWPKH